MKISLVVAQSLNRVIGKDNELPWRLPADLKHFKTLTMGKPIVMGRKTYNSIGRPLPGRRNLVLSTKQDLDIPGCEVFHSVGDVLQALSAAEEVMVIGGASVYEQFLDVADMIYLTQVDARLDGDTFFPELDKEKWALVSQVHCNADEKNSYDYCFQLFHKRNSS